MIIVVVTEGSNFSLGQNLLKLVTIYAHLDPYINTLNSFKCLCSL